MNGLAWYINGVSKFTGKFGGRIMKKISVLAACAMMILVVGCSKDLKVTVKDNLEVEYGDKLDHSLLFDKDNSDEGITVKEVKNFVAKKTGEQEITVIFTNADEKTKEETLKVTVKDTKKPVIKLKKEKVEITAGDKFNAASNIESVKDPVDGDIKKSEDKKLTKNGYIITNDVNTKKAGSYTVKVTAYDVNGNKAESSYKVTVKKKVQEQTPTQNNNQSSGNGYTSNQGSYNKPTSGNTGSNKPTQSKPQQTCKAGVVHPNAMGNSGKLFNSEQEAINYGNMMSEKDSSIITFSYGQVFDYCDDVMNKWTVNFNYGNNFCDKFGLGC